MVSYGVHVRVSLPSGMARRREWQNVKNTTITSLTKGATYHNYFAMQLACSLAMFSTFLEKLKV